MASMKGKSLWLVCEWIRMAGTSCQHCDMGVSRLRGGYQRSDEQLWHVWIFKGWCGEGRPSALAKQRDRAEGNYGTSYNTRSIPDRVLRKVCVDEVLDTPTPPQD